MIALLAALTGCYSAPEMPPIAEHPRQVLASEVVSRELDAHFPTDLLPLEDGRLALADGYHHRVVLLDGEGGDARPLTDPERFGSPVRLSPAGGGGFWLVSPEAALLEVDTDGLVLSRVLLPDVEPPLEPLDVLEKGDTLIVSDRLGRLSWLDRSSGAVTRSLAQDAEGAPLGLLTELVPAADGGFWGVDARGASLLYFDASGQPGDRLGRFGQWVGALTRPVSLAEGPGATLLVADASQGAVQVFDRDGVALGVLADAGGPLELSHPVAVRVSGDRVWVLDAEGPRLWTLRLGDAELSRARLATGERALRQTLGALGEAGDAATCRGCHDGLYREGRAVWDTALSQHPVDIAPGHPLPEAFPLDEEGQLVCATCHNPHGESERTTLSRTDDAFCEACHGEQVPQEAAEVLDFAGTSHPAGAALAAALAARGEPHPAAQGACLSCHAVHGGSGESLLRPETDGQVCLACHTEQSEVHRNHPVGPEVRGEGFGLDGEAGLSCLSCHALVGGRGEALLAEPMERGLLCGACHEERQALASGAHRALPGAQGTPCLSCHDLHGGSAETHLLRTLHAASAGDPGGCASCHTAEAGAAGHPVEGQLMESGEALTCATCHAPHQPAAAGASGCGECHTEQGDAHSRGGHGATTCLDCHPPHAAPPVAAGALNPSSLACLACHQEGSGGGASRVSAWEHPAPVFTLSGERWQPLAGLPLYGADGAELPPGQSGELTCASCHLTHGPDPVKPGDSLRRPDWKPVCASCHGQDALLLYRYFHQPERRESP